ncbi:Mtq2 protein [Candida orthopsilosis Co 90-125]|uniref:Mtq2 protein n=1 Tax=Candida orthopsilosis (strain 90-125) TaxID=1136231 RepID=H8X160_CANO9|nr:Mtq2 protein [Candida orthopsilosis Co 90-125]CCG22100.1 Mtq2 protein [Candida orthopsilosis Co 90-125]
MLSTPITKNIDYGKVYEPSEDSFYLLDCFEEEKGYLETKFKNKVPLITEIGTGSGIVTTFILQNIIHDGIYIATDINPNACKSVLETVRYNCPTRGHLVDSSQMDLTSSIRPNTIDILIFNPPYVPASEVPEVPVTDEDTRWLDLALLGGEDGMVITWKVLNNIEHILSSDGVAYILFCARNKPDIVADIMRDRGWKVDVVINKKAGWEVLSILRFVRL